MMKLLNNATLDTVQALEQAPSLIKVKEVFRQTAEQYGYTSFLCAAPPRPDEEAFDPILFEEWPRDWRRRYAERKYYQRDPMLQEMYATIDPFTWSDVLGRRKLSAADKAIVLDASSWEMNGGFVVPIYGIGGQVHAVTMAGRTPRADAQARAELHLVSIYAYGRAKRLKRRDTEPFLILRRRERQALLWAAAGKTDWEIGRILGVTASAVHKHIENVKRRLGVRTRVQAIVEAIRQGQIHV